MVYIIMIALVTGLATADFITGWASAFIRGDVKSSEMRKGGIRKLAEIVVMAAAIGVNIAVDMIARYSGAEGVLADIVGAFSAYGVTVYIVLMEIVSILENYVEMNPGAKWATKIMKRLGGVGHDRE